MATPPTAESIFDGLYAVLNSLEAIATLGAGTNAAACDTLSYRFGQLAGILATQLAACCSDLSEHLEKQRRAR